MILELMVKDHMNLLKYLNAVEKELREDPMAAFPIFRTFEWNLEKHFFVEERVIFTSYYHDNVSKYSVFLDLEKQHTNLLKRMKTIKKQVRLERQVNFTEFKAFLMKHKTFEEKNVYPVIDMKIDSKEKDFIIQRIDEIL